MLLLSFVSRKFWWPRRRKFFISRFFFFILKKRMKTSPYYSFRGRNTLVHINKKRFFSLFSKNWLTSRFTKYSQRRLLAFRFLKKKLKRSRFFFRRRSLKMVRLILKFTSNNIFLTVSDTNNKILTYFSSGSVGFSGPTRTTSFASEQIVAKACKFLKKKHFEYVHLIVLSGIFNYKSKSVLDSIMSHGVQVRALTYRIGVAHNGIRARKTKRR